MVLKIKDHLKMSINVSYCKKCNNIMMIRYLDCNLCSKCDK